MSENKMGSAALFSRMKVGKKFACFNHFLGVGNSRATNGLNSLNSGPLVLKTDDMSHQKPSLKCINMHFKASLTRHISPCKNKRVSYEILAGQ